MFFLYRFVHNYRFGASEEETELKAANATTKRVYLIMMASGVLYDLPHSP